MTKPSSRFPRWTRSALLALLLAWPEGQAVTLPPFASRYRFEEFRVPRETIPSPAVPRIEGREAKLYRTQIRREARKPADFAGHLRVAGWGCGTCCEQVAVVDLRTGKVTFPGFTVSCGLNARDPRQKEPGIFYQPDSRLLVVSGIRSRGPEPGVWYSEWTDGGLALLQADVAAPQGTGPASAAGLR